MSLVYLLPLILLAVAISNFFLFRNPNIGAQLNLSIGVILPLRNEAENIEGLISTLSKQKGDLHFYLLDDNSEDKTFELVQQFTAGDPRFTLLAGTALADGWIGKTWALQQLFEKSKEEIIVSMDADVRLSDEAISMAAVTLSESKFDFISPYPRQLAVTFGERLIQPLLQWSWLSTVPLRIAEGSTRKSLAVANGQLFVVRRAALAGIGGYNLIKHAVIDDVFLARALISNGCFGTVINGAAIAQCRMYSSWNEIQAGYGKSLSKAFGSIFGTVIVIIFLFLSSVAPFILGLFGNPYGWLGYFLIISTRVLSAIRTRGQIIDCLLHPISAIALIYLIIHSHLVQNTVTWKGRTL